MFTEDAEVATTSVITNKNTHDDDCHDNADMTVTTANKNNTK